MSRNTVAAAGGMVIFLVVVALGFRELGSPKLQRLRRIDGRTVQMISRLAEGTRTSYAVERMLPPDSSNVQTPMKNPLNGEPIFYRPKTSSQYELCSKFATDDQRDTDDDYKFWRHPKGEFCYSFDATAQNVPGVPYNY